MAKKSEELSDDEKLLNKLAHSLWLVDNLETVSDNPEERKAAYQPVRKEFAVKAKKLMNRLGKSGVVLVLES